MKFIGPNIPAIKTLGEVCLPQKVSKKSIAKQNLVDEQKN